MIQYYIVTTNHDGHKQFLVDRKRTRYKRFWSPQLDLAQPFETEESAKERMAKLKFNSPEIVTKAEAVEIAMELKMDKDVNMGFQPVRTLAKLRYK